MLEDQLICRRRVEKGYVLTLGRGMRKMRAERPILTVYPEEVGAEEASKILVFWRKGE